MTKCANRFAISIAPLAALSWVAITGCASGPPPEPTPLPVSAEADSTLRVPCEAVVRKAAAGGQRVYRENEVEPAAELIWERRGPRYTGEIGTVHVEFVVDSTGRVDMTTLRPVTPASPNLFQSVRVFMATAKFAPAMIGDRPVSQCRKFESQFVAPSTIWGPGSRERQPQNLFNGRDLSGWDVDIPAADSNVRLRSPFVVRDGMLVSLGEPRGHLISDSSHRNYRLEIEYRFPGAPGNAGVLVHASTPRALYGMFPKSIEVQMESGNAGDFWCIVEDIRVPDMERRRGPPATWGITEGKARRIINLTDNSEKPLGQWNTMVIEAVSRSLKVWVNGDLVNDGFDATADHGRIALQSEGSEVEFRKLVLTQLSDK